MNILTLRNIILVRFLVTVPLCHGAEKYKYVGCYDNIEKTKLLNQYTQTLPGTLSPQKCGDICNEKKYAFVGLQKNVCHCGNYPPSELIARNDFACDYPCEGNNTAECGGEARMSVYKTGLTVPIENEIPSKIYLGCYIDDVYEFRVLKGTAESFSDNTPDKCHRICYKYGFRYFGLTYINDCFCGDTIPSKETAISEDECNAHCSGNGNEFCGGGWRLSLYATGITGMCWCCSPDIPEYGRFEGCYKNANGSDIKGLVTMDLSKANSNRRCLNICDQKNFKYAAVLKGSKCLCINELLPSTFRDDDYACDVDKCPGEATEFCGSKDRTRIYRTRHTDAAVTSDNSILLGCYKDMSSYRHLDDSREVFENSLTAERCIDLCKKRGFAFSGTEYGIECHCSHKYPSAYTKVAKEECNVPCSGDSGENCGGPLRLSAYDNGIPHPQALTSSWYEGCFRDDDKDNRMLKGSWNELANNSPDICHKLCLKSGYLFFGLTWIKECFCGDEVPSQELLLNENECQKQCGGDSNKKCGGGWRLSVYRTGLPENDVETNYMGCYKNVNGALLKERKSELSRSLNPKRCFNICDMLGFKYAGVERGIECRCGNNQPAGRSEEESKCGSKCPGNSAETCGKKNYVRVYRTTVEDTVTSTGTDTVSPNCIYSLTSVNGQLTCEGNKIFSEVFESINESVWSNTIVMSPEPDYEFVTYSNSQEVIYNKNGRLYIKPQLQSSVRGSLTLNNCTGNANTEECTRKASSFYILPPVLSAQITTKNSFSFRYGKIQIRAKLPIGDWITPEISLIPKDNRYGRRSYESGRIRIALTRGNKVVSCGNKNEDLGPKVLEAGVYFGPQNGVKEKVFRKKLTENWSNKFHNYTLIWTADDIVFQIDGENTTAILNDQYSTIRNAAGLPPNTEYIYAGGSMLAPFDKEFYIALGVSVGGLRNFPDNCTYGTEKKPWTNTSPKAMLQFWETRSAWNTTWTDEKIAMQIEHVKVFAI